MSKTIHSKIFVFFCFCIVLVDLMYPITFTYDSVHYKLLSDIIVSNEWGNWDPLRGIVFPLMIKSMTVIFGDNQNALLYSMIVFHILLYLFACALFTDYFQNRNKINFNIVYSLIFIVIVMDPIVLGYYHALLTEYVAATLAMGSCYMAYKFYNLATCDLSESKLKQRIILLLYMIFVPFAWHLKQPYIGSVYLPFLFSSLVIIRSQKNKLINPAITYNLFIMASLIISIVGWNLLKTNLGVIPNSMRNISYYLNKAFETKEDSAKKSLIDSYLAIANIYLLNTNPVTITREFSFNRGFQNVVIGYRMYEKENEMINVFPVSELTKAFPISPDELSLFITNVETNYSPPQWFNEISKMRTIISNRFYCFAYLILPLFFVIYFILLLISNCSYVRIILILIGPAFINALLHVFLFKPIDRYAFWGVPLLHLATIISIYALYIRFFGRDEFVDNNPNPLLKRGKTVVRSER